MRIHPKTSSLTDETSVQIIHNFEENNLVNLHIKINLKQASSLAKNNHPKERRTAGSCQYLRTLVVGHGFISNWLYLISSYDELNLLL